MEQIDGKSKKNCNCKKKHYQIKYQEDEKKETKREEMRIGVSLGLGNSLILPTFRKFLLKFTARDPFLLKDNFSTCEAKISDKVEI